tara:strand:+ start:606 stop:1916 length:1311 start_codon:yes stop_codon:yes gene_type:complete
MSILENLGLSGLGNSLSGLGNTISTFRENVDDRTGGLLTRLGEPENQANLIAAASLLSGEGIPASFALRNQVRSNLLANQQRRRQREGIEALKKRFANNPNILSLLDTNPSGVISALTTQAFAPPKQVTPFTALGKAKRDLERGLIEPEEFELIRLNIISPSSSPAKSFQKGGTFLMDDGSTKNLSFDPTTGGYFQLNNGKRTDVDISTATQISEGFYAKTIPTEASFTKNLNTIVQDQNALKKYTSYLKNIKESPQGVSRIGAELSTIFKTLRLDQLSKPELSLKIAQGEVQALLGASRLETVGGGVMTEQDAIRVLRVIGGDVNAFQNPQVVEAAISKIFRDKLKAYETKRKIHNNNVDKAYKNYDKIQPLDFDTSLLSDEVASELGFERRGLPENLNSLTLQELNAIPTENLSMEELGKLRDAFQKFFPKKDD